MGLEGVVGWTLNAEGFGKPGSSCSGWAQRIDARDTCTTRDPESSLQDYYCATWLRRRHPASRYGRPRARAKLSPVCSKTSEKNRRRERSEAAQVRPRRPVRNWDCRHWVDDACRCSGGLIEASFVIVVSLPAVTPSTCSFSEYRPGVSAGLNLWTICSASPALSVS